MTRCCLILGDQLSADLSALQTLEPQDVVLMAEVWSEATYVNHHKQKIALIFSAMRHFRDALRQSGRTVHYVTLDDPDNTQDLTTELERMQAVHEFSGWVLTEPGEWRLKVAFESLANRADYPIEILEDTRFFASHARFSSFLSGRKQPRMEHFYRAMRKETGLLMDGAEPAGGQWNFDHDNRKKFTGGALPAPMTWPEDAITTEVKSLVNKRFANHFGTLESWFWPVTREQALEALQYFIAERLPFFGDFQDALVAEEDTLFHSLLSTSMHLGLLSPREVCVAAEMAYRDDQAPINAVEGFIRQILGWREYVRGLYWAYMPEYKERNGLKADWPLPEFFWDESQTDMRCIQEAVRNTREHAYAHHIQRLMVTGNFALISGCRVSDVTDWYLAVYADAFEWVELPNTLGMALFADGGLMGSKPYCASGKYIDRMSDYCKGCVYSVKAVDTADACPMNYLYWDFLATHRAAFANNPRMAMVLKNLHRMDSEKLSRVRKLAADFKARVNATGSDRQSKAQGALL